MNKYLEKIASVNWSKVKDLAVKNPGVAIGGTLLGAEGLGSTTRKPHEKKHQYHLRQVKNTIVGAGTGAVAGKVIQEGLKQVLK